MSVCVGVLDAVPVPVPDPDPDPDSVCVWLGV